MVNAKRLLFALLLSRMGGSRLSRFQRGFGMRRLGLQGAAVGLLGNFAFNAFQHYMRQRQAGATETTTTNSMGAASSMPPAPKETSSAAEDGTAQTLVRAMIMAAKADGVIDETERQRIVTHLASAGVGHEERQFLLGEMEKPVDIDLLVNTVGNSTQAQEVYIASLLTIDINTPAEKTYMRKLAKALNLDKATIMELHERFDVPMPPTQ